MPKGRGSNPSTEHIGSWYRHNNCTDYASIGSRASATSTGFMLDTKRESRLLQPTAPPQTFDHKSQTIYSQANPFSYHDNRNNIQLKGEYLGNGKNTRYLGRRIADSESNQHTSEVTEFLKHHGRDATDSFFHSNYMISHDGKMPEVVPHRRFPKKYSAGMSGRKTVSAHTESVPLHDTSSQTLVSSLEPYAKHNSWKYTYHRHNKHDIYPKAWGDRCSIHLPEQKPRNRPIMVHRVERECTTCT